MNRHPHDVEDEALGRMLHARLLAEARQFVGEQFGPTTRAVGEAEEPAETPPRLRLVRPHYLAAGAVSLAAQPLVARASEVWMGLTLPV